eukprot:CAMPEP_0185571486 /NCGR_PEP_ID=MMETSP0434-20130131/3534_1 /TAXON_ID=626734 ORGANISM="Favella taraikaensis, Strain Fe Narragansett Bay" /NCGR_SAMPLE_ID=MMETSP0434 /ASSEMBLY_ACC=CAM_ASM_000379 /LENGTH=209 /DNA_ID=CAMNT_0028186945 /DNA_START=20 /DNA_END=649 /DNA_ORIENTATION=+
MPMHPCTEADYAKFNPPDERSVSLLDKLKENGGLFCLDLKNMSDYVMRGRYEESNFTINDLIAVPCHTRETALGGTEDNIRDDCNLVKEDAIKYMKNLSIMTYYNYDKFNPEGFEDENRVQKRSKLHKLKLNEQQVSWTPTFLRKTALNDEISLLQYGQVEEIEFESLRFDQTIPSNFKFWPTADEPDNKYKFGSISLFFDQSQSVIER